MSVDASIQSTCLKRFSRFLARGTRILKKNKIFENFQPLNKKNLIVIFCLAVARHQIDAI